MLDEYRYLTMFTFFATVTVAKKQGCTGEAIQGVKECLTAKKIRLD